MTDQELLDLAAKAAGWDAWFWHNTIDGSRLYIEAKKNADPVAWNPLTDDGDALRLAVGMGMQIHINHDAAGFSAIAVLQSSTLGARTFVEVGADDAAASTRRAIVRAAASIGKLKS